MWTWWLAVGVSVFVALVWWTVRLSTARDRERFEPTVGDDSVVTMGVANDAAERAERGECRYCGQRAEHRVPRIVHDRPVLDALLRRLGVVPMAKFRLAIHHDDLSAPVDLCRRHWSRARTLLECELGKVPAKYARHADEQTRELIDFEAHGLHEQMEADAQASTKRKRKPAAVVSIATGKGNGTSG